jgi:hypothetical protein
MNDFLPKEQTQQLTPQNTSLATVKKTSNQQR